MKMTVSVLSAMNKQFVFNNLCGKAARTVIFQKCVTLCRFALDSFVSFVVERFSVVGLQVAE